jgi:hypothetical protein
MDMIVKRLVQFNQFIGRHIHSRETHVIDRSLNCLNVALATPFGGKPRDHRFKRCSAQYRFLH